MTTSASSPGVHLSIHACQGTSAGRGIGRYVHDHALAVVRGYRELVKGLHIDGELPAPAFLADFSGYGLVTNDPRQAVRSHTDGLLLFHIMSPVELEIPLKRLLPPEFKNARAATIATLYDLIPLVHAETYLTDTTLRHRYLARLQLVKEADHVLAISQATKDDAVQHLGLDPETITVIHGGVDAFFTPAGEPRQVLRARLRRNIPDLADPFIFYPGGIEYRKNMEGAIEAFGRLPDHLRRTHQFVVGGHMLPAERESLRTHARKLGVEARVIMPGFLTDDLFRDLYRACEVMVFPSLYEGLGLPILEAMACGAPVVASDASSMKELVEMAEARFDPRDPGDIARATAKALTDPGFRTALVEYGSAVRGRYTWNEVARRTAECYESLGRDSKRNRWHDSRPRRIAVCTPYPPEQSGVADYTMQFLDRLVRQRPVRVDVVVKAEPASYRQPVDWTINLVSQTQFQWLANQSHYDEIIYCMGNSPFHDFVYDRLKQNPGVVWLHDVRLTGFYSSYLRERGQDPEALGGTFSSFAQSYPDWRNGLLERDPVTMHRQGIYLCGEVLQHATRAIVGSNFSRDVAAIDGRTKKPITVLPHASMPASAVTPGEARERLSRRYHIPPGPLVVSMGIVAPVKQPDLILQSCAALRRPATLAFVGPCDPSYRRSLEDMVRDVGANLRLVFTDYVAEAELDEWLAAADCAVQLRFPSNGESSGAVMRALARGTPTVVNDHGSFKELPAEAVIKVETGASPQQVARVLESALFDKEVRERLRDAALRYAEEVSFENIIDRFWEEIVLAA